MRHSAACLVGLNVLSKLDLLQDLLPVFGKIKKDSYNL